MHHDHLSDFKFDFEFELKFCKNGPQKQNRPEVNSLSLVLLLYL